MRRTLIALAAGAACLIAAAPAAAQVGATNACWWTFPGTWSTETFSLSGVASPAQSAGAGTPITLSGTTATITLPQAVIESGVGLGVLQAGENEIAIRAWLAIRGENTVEGVQTRETTTSARTTIVLGPEGQLVSATPLTVTGTFGDTQWTAAATGPVAFAQAGAGSLTGLPVRQAQPGSIHVTASLGTLSLQIECQPGTRAGTGDAPAAGAAPVFAGVAGPPGSSAPPLAVKPKAPRLTLRTSTLKADRQGRVTVRLRCSDAPCVGTVALLNAKKKAATHRVEYRLAAGQTKAYRLRLTAATRRALRERSLSVRVTTVPSAGEPIASKRTLVRTRR
jgi:hypothetical protein